MIWPNFINKFNLKIAYLHKLDNISDLERSENKDYISITNENLDLLKQELYQQFLIFISLFDKLDVLMKKSEVKVCQILKVL